MMISNLYYNKFINISNKIVTKMLQGKDNQEQVFLLVLVLVADLIMKKF